jgi:2,3-bisphosphoglycerate-dependent phosphoglycerate mutase
MDLTWIPAHPCWRLTERHYGALEGLNKAESPAKFGEGRVKLWRRCYDARPPQITVGDDRYPGRHPRYRQLRPDELALGESLKDTASRLCLIGSIRPLRCCGANKTCWWWRAEIAFALVKYLDGISDDDIADVEIPCGIPLIYELDQHLNRIGSHYLGGPLTNERTVA